MGSTIRAGTGARRPCRSLGRWLSDLSFEHPAQHLVLEELIQRIERAEALAARIEASMPSGAAGTPRPHRIELLPRWTLAPVVEAVQALRGVSMLNAITLVAEIGSFSRFDNPRQLMAPTVPEAGPGAVGAFERQHGPSRADHPDQRQDGTGNSLARTCPKHGSGSRRPGPTASRPGCRGSFSSAPNTCPSRSGRWRGRRELRLCRRYRHLMATGKAAPPGPSKVVTAIARALLGFIWAIARMVEPAHA